MLAGVVCTLSCLLLVSSAVAEDEDDYEHQVLHVQILSDASIDSINQRYGTTTIDSLPPLYLLDLPEGWSEDTLEELLEDDPDIVEAELAWEGETPESSRQMVVSAVGGTIEDFLDQGIAARLRLADAHRHVQGDGVLVAVIDTGVSADHPALAGVVAPGGYDFVDDDPDPTDEADGVDNDGDGQVDEGAGHGTMIAGIVRLVAPNARILPIRVLDDEGLGRTFNVAKGIRHAVEQGAQIINLSLGLRHHAMVLRHEILRAEDRAVMMTSAAGNDGVENPQFFPASENQVLSIAALDSCDVKAEFSNWHQEVEISAPGVGVRAPYHDGEYAIGAGTSFSTAFVSGQCALILSLHPGLPPEDIRETVRLGVLEIDDIPGNEEYAGRLGTGRLDAYETWLHAPKAASVEAWPPAETGSEWKAFPNPSVSGEPIRFRRAGEAGRAPGGAWILDVRGRKVARLATGGGEPGLLVWNGRDRAGRPVSAGVYFLRLEGDARNRPDASPLLLLDR
ncbi:MAG: S8 family serine peptidase [Candidatus Eisenbacteria bacterium]|nr:S8 family serine peptidase [Candidatus Latescibacterota bacterium]MBD3302338.1 S8 family serine peptidase [Candidatus Eisenbacteria bacterium]